MCQAVPNSYSLARGLTYWKESTHILVREWQEVGVQNTLVQVALENDRLFVPVPGLAIIIPGPARGQHEVQVLAIRAHVVQPLPEQVLQTRSTCTGTNKKDFFCSHSNG